jgi:hypothetical protein
VKDTKPDQTLFLTLNVILATASVALVASPLVSSSKNGIQSVGSFILFWSALPAFWLIGLAMKRGLLTSFLWALLWFFGTGAVVLTAGMLIHGVH